MQVAKCTIVCLLILYFGNRIIHYKDRFSPTRIFNLWWTVCIGMSLYPVWGRNVASNEIYLTLLVAVICFNFGAFCGRKKYVFRKSKRISNCNVSDSEGVVIPNLKAIYIMNLIALVLNLWLFLRCFSLYGYSMFSSVGSARDGIYASDSVLTSAVDVYLHSYLLRGALYTLIVFLPSIFVEKEYRKATLFSLGNELLYTFIYGGRMFLFYMALLLIVGIGIQNRSKSISLKKLKIQSQKSVRRKFKLILMLSLLCVFVVFLTFSRNNSQHENGLRYFIDKSITYFSSAPMYYQVLQERTLISEQSGFLCTLIGGIITFLSRINSIIGFELIPDVVSIASSHLTSSLVNVGGDVYTNAFPTMVYTFRFDFGMAGVIINSFIFGFISSYIYRKYFYHNNSRFYYLYMVVVYFIFESPMRWTGQQFWPYFTIAVIFLCTSRKKKRYFPESTA